MHTDESPSLAGGETEQTALVAKLFGVCCVICEEMGVRRHAERMIRAREDGSLGSMKLTFNVYMQ